MPMKPSRILSLAALALASCTSDGPIAYETCEVGGRACRGVDGCSEVRVEYVEGTASAGICTSLCATDATCPLDARGVRGACLEFPGVTECFERCTRGEDCPEGLGCVDRLVDSAGNLQFLGAAVCLPALSR